jgi:phospholipase C
MKLGRVAVASALAATGIVAVGVSAATQSDARNKAAIKIDPNIHKIKHVIVIMQENRSFDSYFGTFPGADGIPAGVCLHDPRNGGCRRPWVDHRDSNGNDPHAEIPFQADVNGGKMNGFVAIAERMLCKPKPAKCHPDVMGYHVGSDIPNYWKYAQNFVLQDHFFEAPGSWSLPAHLYMVSGWSAKCTRTGDPMSCRSTNMPPERLPSRPTPFAWTDLTWLLHRHHVTWAYYLDHGAVTVDLRNRSGVSVHWNPLPGFTDVHQDQQLGGMRPLSVFYQQAKDGTLPKVSWVAPDFRDSEHGPALVSTGQSFVTKVINAVMRSPDWASSAIFDGQGYGIREPALVISPYAKKGFIDHQVLTTDAYLKFIEDDFLGGARLNPATDGRRDPRPTVRENASILGNLINDFDFTQTPRPPMTLRPCPPTTLIPKPARFCIDHIALHVNQWGDS